MNYLTWSNLQNITLNQKRKNNSSSKELNSEQYAPTVKKKKSYLYMCVYIHRTFLIYIASKERQLAIKGIRETDVSLNIVS